MSQLSYSMARLGRGPAFGAVSALRGFILVAAAMCFPGAAPASAGPDTVDAVLAPADILIIAHRGASGERPEHTLAAYERAIDQGADYIEPDLVPTKDGVLVARHETEISGTTDVAERPEFAARKRSKQIDGREVTGWFTEDFTLAELRQLRARERLPELREANAAYDGLYQVPTLAEIVQLVRAKEVEAGRQIGLYPELKHPGYLMEQHDIDMVALLLSTFEALGVTSRDAVFIQCFEVGPLERLNRESDFALVQLVASQGGPADKPALRYRDMVSPAGLADVARYAGGLGADITLILNPDGSPTTLVADARRAGLVHGVHGWTLRKENAFMPPALRSPGIPSDTGRYDVLWALLERAGVSGVFTDDPALAAQARHAAIVSTDAVD